ncbi:MAG TPA: hypothetical protein VM734_11415 [Kofleriaceae bacterium]|jgi:hypothetical protein|nr:hypothetical protein [Kofleriaceae bacterium]
MRSAVLIALAGLSGCVLSPTDDGTVTSRIDPLTMTGYASAAGARVQIRAWNHDRADWDVVREVRSGNTGIGRDVQIFGWNANNLLLGDRYWYGGTAACPTGSGMSLIEVRELRGTTWSPLATFDAAGRACLEAKLADGVDFVAAGNACRTGDELVLFAPQQCTAVAASDPTPPRVVLRATDDDRVWEVTDGDLVGPFAEVSNRPLRLRVDAFDAQGVSLAQADYEREIRCRLASGATYTVREVGRIYAPPVGSTAGISAGAAIDTTRASIQGYCGSNTVAGVVIRVAGGRGDNARGTVRTTPGMTFTVTY